METIELEDFRLYTVKELSKILNLSCRQILKLCREMRINYIECGGAKRKKKYFTKRIIEDFLKNVK